MTHEYAIFTLTMPHVKTWNGKWSVSDKNMCISRQLTEEQAKYIQTGNIYRHTFSDGWIAEISVKVVYTDKERKEAIRKSDGFAGYEWMVESILKYHCITE